MAITGKALTVRNRKAVAGQIGSYMRALETFTLRQPGPTGIVRESASESRLSDDFPFRTITLAEVLSPPSDLKQFINQTEMWLHLIRVGQSYTSHALSREGAFPDSEPTLVSYGVGPLAAKIDQVSRRLDDQEKNEEAKAVILAFPAHHTFAFGILRGKKTFAVLIDQPGDYSRLRYERIYSLQEFLKNLSLETNSDGFK